MLLSIQWFPPTRELEFAIDRLISLTQSYHDKQVLSIYWKWRPYLTLKAHMSEILSCIQTLLAVSVHT